jgi:hypothetical protein
VDLDGMFVPEMAGWNASELGHQHFQHPERNAGWFDGTLDNFSSVVVYLSLISLAERPALWAKYHDENLLFTKSDFLDTANSPLLAEVREIGAQHRNLADILITAIENGPGEVPYLLDLVEIESNLPGWISGPAGIEVEGKTREAGRAVAYAVDRPPAQGRWRKWDPNQVPAELLSGAGGLQRGLSGQPVTIAAAALVPQTFAGISKAAVGNAKELLVNGFLWWYWGVFIVLTILGLEFLYALPVAILIVAIISVIYGYIRAYNDSAAGALVQPLFPNKPLPTPRWSPTPSVGSSVTVVASLPPAQPSGAHSLVGNRALGIYHFAGCAWEMKIAASNRVGFISRVDAESAGYRSCKVCTP